MAHLNGGMAGLRVHAPCMSHAHSQIHIPHHFTVYKIWHFLHGQTAKSLPVGKFHPLQSGTFHITGRKPVCQSINPGDDIFLIKDFLQSFLIVSNPAAAPKASHCSGWLNLVSGKHPGIFLSHFLWKLYIQLPEHLFKGLTNSFVKQKFLVLMPLASLIQIKRMGNGNLICGRKPNFLTVPCSKTQTSFF